MQRILQVDQGTFTPLVFSATGGMGNECKVFISRLSSLIAIKHDVDKSIVTNWLRTKLSFALIRSLLLCIRGSRTTKQTIVTSSNNIELEI